MTPGFETFIAFLATVGVIMYGWGQYRNGKSAAGQRQSQDAESTVTILKTRADEFEKQLGEARKQHQENHDEIIRLQESLKLKDERIKEYLGIIQNRNPDLEKTLIEVRNFLESLNKHIGNGNAIVIDAAHTAV